MDINAFRKFCEEKKGSQLSFPFDNLHMVFKVGGKIFALAPLEPFERINLKCDPEKSLELRANNSSIIPGWHMNKKHWNTVLLNGNLSNYEICQMIDHSYDLVWKNLSKKVSDGILSKPFHNL